MLIRPVHVRHPLWRTPWLLPMSSNGRFRQPAAFIHCSSGNGNASKDVPCIGKATDRALLIVTGASRGFGSCFAHAVLSHPKLLAPDAGVLDAVLLSSDPRSLDKQLHRVQKRFHALPDNGPGHHKPRLTIVGKAFDLGNLDQLETNVHSVLSDQSTGGMLPVPPWHYTSVTVLHNAGTTGELALLKDQTLANIRRQFDINVTSFAYFTARLLATFADTSATGAQLPASVAHSSIGTGVAAAGTGRTTPDHPPPPNRCRDLVIINLSSVSVNTAYEAFSIYSAGKAARHMVVQSVALESSLLHPPATGPVPTGTKDVQKHTHRASQGARLNLNESLPHSSPTSSSNRNGVSTAPTTSALAPHVNVLTAGRSEGMVAESLPPGAAAQSPRCRVRAFSYAPGAIDTDMQTAARESLPEGLPLKVKFEENHRHGRLVDPNASAATLLRILHEGRFTNGAHLDYYSSTEGASHPLSKAS